MACDASLPLVFKADVEQPARRRAVATSHLRCKGRPIAMLSIDFSLSICSDVDQPFAPIHGGSFSFKLIAAMTGRGQRHGFFEALSCKEPADEYQNKTPFAKS